MPLAAGTRLGVFEILAPLANGVMGNVCRAKDTKLEREVALKILPAVPTLAAMREKGRNWGGREGGDGVEPAERPGRS